MADPKQYYIQQGRVKYIKPKKRAPFGNKGEEIPVLIFPKEPAPHIEINKFKKFAKPEKKAKAKTAKPEKKPLLTRRRNKVVRDYSPPNLNTSVSIIAQIRETADKIPATKDYIERYRNKDEEKIVPIHGLDIMTYATYRATKYDNTSFLKYIDYYIEHYESRLQILTAIVNEYKYRLIFWLGIQPYAAHQLLLHIDLNHKTFGSSKRTYSLNPTSYYLYYGYYKDYLEELGFKPAGKNYLLKLLREIDTTMMNYLENKDESIHLYEDNNNLVLNERKSKLIREYCKKMDMEIWDYDGELGFPDPIKTGYGLVVKAPLEFLVDLDDNDKKVYEDIGVGKERAIPDYLSPDAKQNLQTIHHNLKLRTFDEYLRDKYHVPGNNHQADIYPPTTEVGRYINMAFHTPDNNRVYVAHSDGRLIIKNNYSLADLIYYYGQDNRDLYHGLRDIAFIPQKFTRFRGDFLCYLFKNEFKFRMLLEHGCDYYATDNLAEGLIVPDGTGGFINMRNFSEFLIAFTNIQAKREVARIMHQIIAEAKEICEEHEWDRGYFMNVGGKSDPHSFFFSEYFFVHDEDHGITPRYQYHPYIEKPMHSYYPNYKKVVDVKDKLRIKYLF